MTPRQIAERKRRHASRRASVDFVAAEKMKIGKCIDCGFVCDERTYVAFDFDHRDPTQKRFGIAKAARDLVPKARLLEEIAKCDLRCANCHRIRTAEERHNYAKAEHVRRSPLIGDLL